MTPQEIFNTAYLGVLRQGKCAVDDQGDCAYRTRELKCAFGHLIPDHLYSERMEGHRAPAIFKEYPAIAKLIGPNLDLVFELQNVHDNASGASVNEAYQMEDFANRAADIARRYHLEIPNV